MKICYAGNFKQVRSTEGYVADALDRQIGCEVVRLQENEFSHTEMLFRIRDEKPDVFLFSKCELRYLPFKEMLNDPKILLNFLGDLRQIGVRPVCWVFDLMRNEFSGPRFRWSQAVADYCHLFLTTDSNDLGLKNHRCLRQGCAPPGPEAPAPIRPWMAGYDVIHVGDVYGDRKKWFRTLHGRLGNKYGVIHSAFEDRLRAICQQVKIIAGPPYPYFPGYWSNRLYLITGYKGCFVAPLVPGMREEGWKDGENMIAAPLDNESAAEQLVDLLKDEERLRYVAQTGMDFVWSNHTYGHRAALLLEWLNGSTPQGGTSDASTQSQVRREDPHR